MSEVERRTTLCSPAYGLLTSKVLTLELDGQFRGVGFRVAVSECRLIDAVGRPFGSWELELELG